MTLSEWHESTLDNVCSKITDGAHHSPKSVDVGKPMASVKDMTTFGIKLESCRLISEEDFEKLVKQGCKPEVDDVLIAKDGNSALDTVCRIRKRLDVVLLSSVAILRPDKKKIDPEFLRLYLDTEPTRNYLKSSAISGAAIPRVILKDFKRAKIKLPNIKEQIKISSTLGAYDNLIENNYRRIAILEEMAQSLYREWFVKFRFPGFENTKFIDSPLGKIPEGWEVKKLKDACHLTMGQSPKSEFYNDTGEGLPFFQGVTDFGQRFPTVRIWCSKPTRLAQSNDVLFSVRAPVGRLNIADQELAIGRGLCAIRSTNGLQSLLFQQLKSIFTSEDMIGNGAIFASVTKKDMEDIKLIEPEVRYAVGFCKKVDPVFDLLDKLFKKNELLKSQRDMILPKLISGKVLLNA